MQCSKVTCCQFNLDGDDVCICVTESVRKRQRGGVWQSKLNFKSSYAPKTKYLSFICLLSACISPLFHPCVCFMYYYTALVVLMNTAEILLIFYFSDFLLPSSTLCTSSSFPFFYSTPLSIIASPYSLHP